MKKGFSLVEIMIVVAIIAILASIAIPNIVRSRLNSSENNAISNLQTISAATQTYWSVKNVLPTTLRQLFVESLVDATLGCTAATCTKDGYSYSLGGTGVDTDFFIYTIPQTPNVTGIRSFCSDSDGVTRVSATGATPLNRTECIAWNAL